MSCIPRTGSSFNNCAILSDILLNFKDDVKVFKGPQGDSIRGTLSILEELGVRGLTCGGYSSLSNNRGRVMLVTETVTYSPRVLVLSRPRSGLSFGGRVAILSILSGLHSDKVYYVFGARFPSRTLEVTSETLLLKSSKEYVYNGAASVIARRGVRGAFNIGIGVTRIASNNEAIGAVIPMDTTSNFRGVQGGYR